MEELNKDLSQLINEYRNSRDSNLENIISKFEILIDHYIVLKKDNNIAEQKSMIKEAFIHTINKIKNFRILEEKLVSYRKENIFLRRSLGLS